MPADTSIYPRETTIAGRTATLHEIVPGALISATCADGRIEFYNIVPPYDPDDPDDVISNAERDHRRQLRAEAQRVLDQELRALQRQDDIRRSIARTSITPAEAREQEWQFEAMLAHAGREQQRQQAQPTWPRPDPRPSHRHEPHAHATVVVR